MAVEAFLRRHIAKVFAVELTVLSVTHKYAGTLDLWALGIDGPVGLESSGNIYVEHAVQLAERERLRRCAGSSSLRAGRSCSIASSRDLR